MTALELATIGERIYGERWLLPMARALGVDLRTVRRWATDRREIPEPIAEDVRALLAIATRHGENQE